MKTTVCCLLTICTLLFCTCKKDQWTEWKIQNTAWLEQHQQNDTAITVTASGLRYKIIDDPNTYEAKPNDNSIILCDYQLFLIDGTCIENAANAVITLETTIEGFREGMKKIHVHGDIQMWIPYNLGYNETGSGSEGALSFIPPYSTLIYKVHLKRVYAE